MLHNRLRNREKPYEKELQGTKDSHFKSGSILIRHAVNTD